LCTLRKSFQVDRDRLNEELVSEANIGRRNAYRERFSVEQRKEILSHFKKHLSETETVMFYLDFVDQFYPVENKVQTVSKEKWVKEDNNSSSHPP
jgi:predicted glycoside hydrolase/deacetylase ChbG (UPF0249 family)